MQECKRTLTEDENPRKTTMREDHEDARGWRESEGGENQRVTRGREFERTRGREDENPRERQEDDKATGIREDENAKDDENARG